MVIMIYGYARVSTRKQVKEGNSLEDQENILKANGAEIVYKEGYTGTKKDRPELIKLLKEVKDGDTIVVTKLDRVARNTAQGIELINDLIAMGVKVNILNMGVMDNTPTGKLIRTIMLAFAEFERDMIVERTQEGKAIASEKEGFKDGRPPKYKRFTMESALGQLTVNGGQYSYREVSEKTGISESTLKRAQRERRLSNEKN